MSTQTLTTATADAPPPRGPSAPRPGLPATTRKWLVRGLIAVILVIEIYPIFWILSGSFKTQEQFLNEPLWSLPTSFGFDNFVTAMTTGNLGTNLLNSLLVTVPSLLLILALGAGAAFALEVMLWPGRTKVLLFVVAGIMVPAQIILLPLFTIYFKTGLANSYWPLIITYIGHGLPLTVFLLATYFRAVPRELFEACALDGGGTLRCFLSVGLPMIRNGLFTVALLMFFSVWNDLLIALTFNTRSDLATVQVGLLNFNGEYGSVAYGPPFAAIITAILGTLVVYLSINQQVMKGVAAGSLKG